MLRTFCSVYRVFRYCIQESRRSVFGPFPIKTVKWALDRYSTLMETWIFVRSLLPRMFEAAIFRLDTPSYLFLYWTYVQPLISRSRWPRGLRRTSAAARLLRSWVRIQSAHGCLSVVSVVCCRVDVCALGWSLVQRSRTDCGASLSVI